MNSARSILLKPKRLLLLLASAGCCLPGTTLLVKAQNQPPPVDPLVQLQLSQPNIEVVSNATATAAFDPPVIRPGGKATYRVTFNALDDSIKWPRDLIAPPELELRRSARGQIFIPGGYRLIPFSAINYHVRATKEGTFTIPQFTVEVYGNRVTVPAATLRVTADPAVSIPWAPSLELHIAETNIFAGQSVNVHVVMSPSPSNQLQSLTQLKFTGEGFLTDAGAGQQNNTIISRTLAYDTVLTPIVSGRVTVTAQGFFAGNRFEGPFIIRGSGTITTAQFGGGVDSASPFSLVDSVPVSLTVKPLPKAGQLPGFNGAIGLFTNEPPLLQAKQVRVGDLVKLEVTFRGEGNLARLVMPPPPKAAGWQVFPAEIGGLPLPNRPPPAPGNLVRFTYTLIPLTNGLNATPVIPFSFFDPKRAAYVDLSIPSVPITVHAGSELADWPVGAETNALAATEKKLALSNLATTPGRTSGSLRPLQQQAWFVGVQALPVLGLIGLWGWDRRRRFLEKNPDILLRRRARRALRREWRVLEQARRAGDTARYAAAAVTALRVACAPHYPAEPRALVGRDILELFDEGERTGRTGEVVRKVFSFVDASSFAGKTAEANGLLALHPELNGVLKRLEARL